MSDDAPSLSDDFLEFKCPQCGETNTFPDTDAGAVQQCPYCGGILVVPDKTGEAGKAFPIPVIMPRLILRLLNSTDTGALGRFMGSEELFRHTPMTPMDETDLQDWLGDDFKNSLLDPGKSLWLGLELKEGGEVIGCASLDYTREAPGAQADRQASFFLLIAPNHQRKGFGLEAVQGLLQLCFSGIKVRRVTATCDKRNETAKAFLARAGLRLEGEFYQDAFVKGEWVDRDYFAMLAEEYRGGAQSAPAPAQ